MNLIRWRRAHDLPSLFDEMNALLSEAATATGIPLQRWTGAESTSAPAVDMYETEDEVVVRAEMPGVDRENMEVTAEKSAITVKGESRCEEETEEKGYHRREICYGSYTRTLATPSEIDPDSVTAKYEDGILTIHAAKVEAEGGRKIEVQ